MKTMSYNPEKSRTVEGWKDEDGDDVYLLFRYLNTETPEVDIPANLQMLYGALFDAFQCNEGVDEGDLLVSPWGTLVCTGDCFDPFHKWIDGKAVPFNDDDFTNNENGETR